MNAIRKLLFGLGVAAVAALWLSPVRAAPVLIDDFSVPGPGVQQVTATGASPNPLVVGPNPASPLLPPNPLSTTNVASGNRQITITRTTGGATATLAVNPGGSGVLSHGNDPNTASNANVSWDFLLGSGTLDLSDQTKLILDDVTIDVGTASFTFRFNSGAFTFPLEQRTGPFAGDIEFDLTLVPLGIRSAVDRLELLTNTDIGPNPGLTDITIEQVITQNNGGEVPEPASIALWSLLGLGAVGYARRTWGKGRKVTA